MPNSIKSLELKGQFFDNTVMLPIFNNKRHRISIIYGRNGSGKSSIARAFDAYNNKKNSSEYIFDEIKLYDYNNNGINKLELDYNIYVFDENFISANIDIKEEGLDSIVMFGEQIEIDTIIEKNKEKIKQNDKEIIRLNHIIESLEKRDNTEAPSFYINRIEESLKETDSWAERDKKIKQNKQNSRVNMAIIKEIIDKFKTNKSKKDLEEEYINLKKEYNLISQSESYIEDNLKPIDISLKIAKIENSLKKEMKKTPTTDREDRIKESIRIKGTNLINKAYDSFEKHNEDVCPYCFRDITEDYILELLKSFDNIFNKEVEDHLVALKNNKINLQSISFEQYKSVNETHCNTLKEKLELINKEITEINVYMDKKINNPFVSIQYNMSKIKDYINSYNNIIVEMKKHIVEYNTKIDSINKLKENLIELNKNIAYLYIKDDFVLYNSKKENLEKKIKDRCLMIEKNSKIKEENIGLNAKKNNIEIAIDVINNNLSYIFYDPDRLKLETDGENYLLKVRGKRVTPNKVSIGERNALALCYYFTMICENLEEDQMYSEKKLLVIDDPISSFDSDNKIGTLSYLSKELKKTIISNSLTRVIIMSHDILATDAFIKIGDDIGKVLDYKSKKCYSINKIENKQMILFDGKIKNEYSFSLNKIHDFIYEEDDDLTIGNTMRRVLEAFSTFQYKISMNELLIEEDILKTIENENQREKLENYMSRILLNDESHSEMRVKDIDNINLPQIYSVEEKKRTGKAILCLMYLLNKNHIKYHMSNDQSENIKQWCEEMIE